MKSRLPKVLHPVAGVPMVVHVTRAAREAGCARIVAVVGYGAERVMEALSGEAEPVYQREQLGTGHALAQAAAAARDAEHLLVLHGDVPLTRPETLRRMMAAHLASDADLTLLTAIVDDARAYGRVRRDAEGRVLDVVEASELEPGESAGGEINAGMYCFRASWVWPRLASVPRSAQGEYYLTHLVGLASREGARVAAITADDPSEALGVNDRIELAEADHIVRERIRRFHMLNGVTLIDPPTVYIDADVVIGQDSVIGPNVTLAGKTRIGADARIGPGSVVRDSVVGDRCRIELSVVEEATLEEDVGCGPYSHLRPGAYLCRGVHIGNFAEIKNSRVGRNTKMGHFSYLGDADVGEDVNIGAGTITCNFDGVRKHRTIIGDGAFIGSDTMLVAPVRVGRNARTAAGSVVNRDVPDGKLAVGAPARIRELAAGEGS
jgi:bifunctional UDP-N-acetylglucosamine pyrophosphorylase/glucosamine-1-phosphate N-acetyltransferase